VDSLPRRQLALLATKTRQRDTTNVATVSSVSCSNQIGGDRRGVQIEGRRTEASEPGDGDHSLEFHQPTFVHYLDFLVTPSQFIAIIATIKVRYGAAILNDARRLECPKPLSPTSSSAP
jgi:hypothetical protein